MKKSVFVSFLMLVFAVSGFPQKKSDLARYFDENYLKHTIKFLSDDGFGGRAPGKRQEGELAAKFIAMEMAKAGIKPGNNGSFFQPVDLVAVKANKDAKLKIGNRNATFEYDFGKDFIVTTSAQRRRVRIDNELVFVGHGIDAPNEDWNDYKGKARDYRGKVLVILVNEPLPTNEKARIDLAEKLSLTTVVGHINTKKQRDAALLE